MSDIPELQNVRAAEKVAAERGEKEGSPVIEEPLRTNAREVARTTGSVKSAPPLNKGRAEQSVAERSVRKSAGQAGAAKSSARGDGYVVDVVVSVEELEPMILRAPDNRKKSLTLAEALREHGLDAPKVAAVYAGLVKKLSRNKNEGRVPTDFLPGLRLCSR